MVTSSTTTTEAPATVIGVPIAHFIVYCFDVVITTIFIAGLLYMAYRAPDSLCWNARVKVGSFFCRCKRKKKEGDVEKGEQKDKPATSAQATPSARQALAIGDPDSKSKSTNSNDTRNSTPLASPAAPAPTVPSAQPVPVPIKILDAAKGTVDKKHTAQQVAAAIDGGLQREQKDDESVDDVPSQWGNTQPLKTADDDKSGVSGVSGASGVDKKSK